MITLFLVSLEKIELGLISQNTIFWPGAHNDVINWVRSCISCNEFNVSSDIHRPLQPIPIENRFEFVC